MVAPDRDKDPLSIFASGYITSLKQLPPLPPTLYKSYEAIHRSIENPSSTLSTKKKKKKGKEKSLDKQTKVKVSAIYRQ
jgi:hypothetical protein